VNEAGAHEVEMYGNELLMDNPSDQMVEVRVRKRESQDDVISEILSDGKPLGWTTEDEHHVFGDRIGPRSEKLFKVVYREQAYAERARRPWRFELSVAMRRVLSEFRDDYLAKSPFLSAPADRLKNLLRKTM
jgi:hypothetical protein